MSTIESQTGRSIRIQGTPPPDSVCQRAGFDRCVVRLLDVLEAGILICSETGRLRYVNPAGCAILAVAEREMRGTMIDQLLAPLADLRARARDVEGASSPELAITTRDGRELKIGFRLGAGPALGLADKEPLVVLLFQDITSFVEVREERNRLLGLEAVSRLLPTIAHEIKNPLAGIQCLAEALQDSLQDEEQREDLRAILSEVERMRLIIDGLGLAGRSLTRSRARTDVCGELAALERLVAARARRLGVGLELACRLKGPAAVDPGTLRLVMINLLNNALDACSEGDRVLAEIDRHDGMLELDVSDTGAGMTEEAARRATDLFFTTKPKGSGIGLALIAQLVDLDQGSLRIDSRLGRGTSVSIRVHEGGDR